VEDAVQLGGVPDESVARAGVLVEHAEAFGVELARVVAGVSLGAQIEGALAQELAAREAPLIRVVCGVDARVVVGVERGRDAAQLRVAARGGDTQLSSGGVLVVKAELLVGALRGAEGRRACAPDRYARRPRRAPSRASPRRC
jgi:hypothetical protein